MHRIRGYDVDVRLRSGLRIIVPPSAESQRGERHCLMRAVKYNMYLSFENRSSNAVLPMQRPSERPPTRIFSCAE